jgi:uncharacterized protein (TIGR00106 family)
MFPTDRRGGSVSADVAKVIDVIDKSGLPYKLTAMSTLIEGEWNAVMAVVNKARLRLRRSHSRVYIIMTIDDRKGARNRLTGKVQSVESRLGREVKK